jgi:hypothetical protein
MDEVALIREIASGLHDAHPVVDETDVSGGNARTGVIFVAGEFQGERWEGVLQLKVLDHWTEDEDGVRE